MNIYWGDTEYQLKRRRELGENNTRTIDRDGALRALHFRGHLAS